MRNAGEIFHISSEALTELILEYYASLNVPGRLADQLEFHEEYCVSDESVLATHPDIAEMIVRDQYGEGIGPAFRSELDLQKYCLPDPKEKRYLLYDREYRLVAFRRFTDPMRPDRLYDIEVFEYNGDIRYSRSAGCVTCGEENHGFSYYRYQNGHVAELLNVIGNFGGYGNEDPFALELPSSLQVNHFAFSDAPEHELIRKDHYELSYSKPSGRYMIGKRYDWLNPLPQKEPAKRVIDTQKRLRNTLTKKVSGKTTLSDAVKCFFEVIAGAKPNDEEMLLYEVGFNRREDGSDMCYVSLVRQTPTKQDEYYQLHLELKYEVRDRDVSLKDCIWHEPGDEDLKEYIFSSAAYRMYKDRVAETVEIWVDET